MKKSLGENFETKLPTKKISEKKIKKVKHIKRKMMIKKKKKKGKKKRIKMEIKGKYALKKYKESSKGRRRNGRLNFEEKTSRTKERNIITRNEDNT